jgi:hypothetical protein
MVELTVLNACPETAAQKPRLAKAPFPKREFLSGRGSLYENSLPLFVPLDHSPRDTDESESRRRHDGRVDQCRHREVRTLQNVGCDREGQRARFWTPTSNVIVTT